MSDDEFISPANEFFEVEEENNFENKKEKVEPQESTTFFSFLYKQFECCCLSYFDELKEKDQRRTITLKRNNVDEYNKNKNNINEFSIFNKIIKKNADLMSDIPLNSKYFNSHADWCECAHELDVELSNEEVEFCIFTFFLKMYRLETRDKELLLSIILDCLYSKKDFKKEYYGYKGSFQFLKEIKNIETSNFKESLNSLINLIENMNVTQKHATPSTKRNNPTAINVVNNFHNNNNNNNNNINNNNNNNFHNNISGENKNTYNNFNTNIIPPNNGSTDNTNINNVNNLNKNNNNDTASDYVYRNKNNLESYTSTTLKESNTYSREEINKKIYFKLYVVLKIRYPYGVYIFNCGESYDIVVLDCNTINNNKPKIMSFYSLRKFVSFLNNIHSINYNGEDVYDSFPIIIFESRECYVATNNHVALKPEICQSNRQKEKWKIEENSGDSKNEQNEGNKKKRGSIRGRGNDGEETEEEEEDEEEEDDDDDYDDEDEENEENEDKTKNNENE